jgi:hypothetical protein
MSRQLSLSTWSAGVGPNATSILFVRTPNPKGWQKVAGGRAARPPVDVSGFTVPRRVCQNLPFSAKISATSSRCKIELRTRSGGRLKSLATSGYSLSTLRVEQREADSTLNGLRLFSNERRNPFGVGSKLFVLPRVARCSQPWALWRNPFGIFEREHHA